MSAEWPIGRARRTHRGPAWPGRRRETIGSVLANLVPESFFQGIPVESNWLLWVMLFGAIPPLVFGADLAVSGAVRLARSLGMSKVIVGATIVSLGTTSPETFTSVTAALSGEQGAGLALGNAVGSVICNTALVFGLCCVLRPLPMNRFVLYRHGVLKVGSGLLLTATVLILAAVHGSFTGVVLHRWIGVGLLVLLAGYLYISVVWARQHPEILPDEADVQVDPKSAGGVAGVSGLKVLAGLALVIAGSNVMVGSVLELAQNRYGVDPDLLAVTVVAFGTSLPELVTAVTAVRRGHGDLAVGNVIGADILNILFVVGASATAVPLKVPIAFFQLHLPMMMLAMGLMAAFIYTNKTTFKRWQGLPLLGAYVLFLVLQGLRV